jgi:hypothetical protein
LSRDSATVFVACLSPAAADAAATKSTLVFTRGVHGRQRERAELRGGRAFQQKNGDDEQSDEREDDFARSERAAAAPFEDTSAVTLRLPWDPTQWDKKQVRTGLKSSTERTFLWSCSERGQPENISNL